MDLNTTGTRELFGGAITAIAPRSLIDASDLRQVPDTQEVLLYPDSAASIIVEILESVDRTDPEEIIRFHFDSLAHDNDAKSSEVLSITAPNGVAPAGQTPHPIILKGIQEVPKFNRPTPDNVRIHMAVFRIDHKNTDLVVTFNIPTFVNEGSQMSEAAQAAVAGHFRTFVDSLHIVDFGLFA